MPTLPFNIAAGADDQFVSRSHTSYPPTLGTLVRDSTSGAVVAGRYWDLGSTSQFVIDNTLLKWNTASLAGSTPQSANLNIYPLQILNADSLSLTAGWYSWDGTGSDWTDPPETNAISGISLFALSVNQVNSIPLSNVSNISTSGNTYLRLHISQLASNAAPTGYNFLQLASLEHATGPEPQLEVTYMSGQVLTATPQRYIFY